MCDAASIALIGTALLSANVSRVAQKNAAKDADRMQKEAAAEAERAAAESQAETDAKTQAAQAKADTDAKKATRTFLFSDQIGQESPSKRRSLRLFDDRESLATPLGGAPGGTQSPTLGI